MKLNGLGNCYPSLEIPGQILRVLEGKPWAKSCTNLLPKALGMTNFSWTQSPKPPQDGIDLIYYKSIVICLLGLFQETKEFLFGNVVLKF